MKRFMLIAVLLISVFTVPAFAATADQQSNASSEPFEQKQTRILQLIDNRIADLQEAKTCVQAAKNNDDLKACRQKQMQKMRNKMMNRNNGAQ
jgi:hypothetical protein